MAKKTVRELMDDVKVQDKVIEKAEAEIEKVRSQLVKLAPFKFGDTVVGDRGKAIRVEKIHVSLVKGFRTNPSFIAYGPIFKGNGTLGKLKGKCTKPIE